MQLPTLVAASWSVTALRDSFLQHLERIGGQELRLFFYAVTESGWAEVRRGVHQWLSGKPNRAVVAYLGTDHGITDAEAIRQMERDGVQVRLMTDYSGTFHPKLIWLRAAGRNYFWIGSNNLTRDGLLHNIELAVTLDSKRVPSTLRRWVAEVHNGSVPLDETLLQEYEKERQDFGERRVRLGTFTWSRREKHSVLPGRKRHFRSRVPDKSLAARRGDLVVEVMPRETGEGGKQIQLPVKAAMGFFGLKGHVGETRTISLTPAWIRDARNLTMTVFGNHTVRLVIRELDYRDRPCVLMFRRRGKSVFQFDIVSRSVFPAKYRELLRRCKPPTRSGSRRWGVVE